MSILTVVATANKVVLGHAVGPEDLAEARVEHGLAPNGEEWPDVRVWARPEPAGWAYGMPAWAIGPDDIEDAPPDASTRSTKVETTMTLAELVEWQVRAFRSLDTGAGDLMADALNQLAIEVGILGATTPDQVFDRRAYLDLMA